MTFTDYAENELKKLPNTKSAYLYKQEVIARMTARANELVESGLTDNKVINELIINEFSDIEKEYYERLKKKKKAAKTKNKSSLIALGIVGYVLLLVGAFLGVSFATGAWDKTWLIIVVGILGAVIAGLAGGCFALFAKKKKMAVFALLIVIPAIAALAYVVLGLIGLLAWHPGWLIIVASVFVDFIIIVGRLVISSKKEVEDEKWEDD
ncbi:MAG: hypothetical protein IKY78_05950 [Clostridia bacterium]|nr:hypothetical protein [Clostridia bacterium]